MGVHPCWCWCLCPCMGCCQDCCLSLNAPGAQLSRLRWLPSPSLLPPHPLPPPAVLQAAQTWDSTGVAKQAYGSERRRTLYNNDKMRGGKGVRYSGGVGKLEGPVGAIDSIPCVVLETPLWRPAFRLYRRMPCACV